MHVLREFGRIKPCPQDLADFGEVENFGNKDDKEEDDGEKREEDLQQHVEEVVEKHFPPALFE